MLKIDKNKLIKIYIESYDSLFYLKNKECIILIKQIYHEYLKEVENVF